MNDLQPTLRKAIIAASSTDSSVVDLDHYQVVALVMPSSWSTANITLKACATRDGTFVDVYDDEGVKVTIVAAPNRVIVLDKAVLATAGLKYIKLCSSAAQDADRVITVILKR